VGWFLREKWVVSDKFIYVIDIKRKEGFILQNLAQGG
jgi:hypothetical protein